MFGEIAAFDFQLRALLGVCVTANGSTLSATHTGTLRVSPVGSRSQLEAKGCYFAKQAPNILAADLLLQSYKYELNMKNGALILGKGEDALLIDVINGQWTCAFNTASSTPSVMALTTREFHSQYPLVGQKSAPSGNVAAATDLSSLKIVVGRTRKVSEGRYRGSSRETWPELEVV